MTASSQRKEAARASEQGRPARSRFLQPLLQALSGDYMPSMVLAVLIATIGMYVASINPRFISAFNLNQMLLLCATLAFIGFGQLCVVLTGAIDLSVGPLAGFIVVVLSFFLPEHASLGLVIAGLAIVLLVGVSVGSVNSLLVQFGNFTSVAATLGTYIVIRGASAFLRPEPSGSIGASATAFIQAHLGALPAAFFIVLAVAIALDIALRHSRWGLSLRAVGSDSAAARRIGVRTTWAIVGAFVLCSVFSALGGIMVTAQVGIGDPNQGIEYTLSSIAAVVLGGASLFGGRGSFVGVLLGAALIGEVNTATTFIGLSEAWQYWFMGILTLAAVAIYSQTRRKSY